MTKHDPRAPLRSIREAAEFLGISVRQLHRIYRDQIAFYRIGRRVLFSDSDLIAFRESHRKNIHPNGV